MIFGLEISSAVSACPSGKEKALDSKQDKGIRTKHKMHVYNF
jgi:hypothetical protein